MASEICNRQKSALVVVRSFRMQSSGENFNFFPGDRGVGEGSWFQIGDRLILLCVFWPGWIEADPLPDQQHWGGFELLLGLRNSIQ